MIWPFLNILFPEQMFKLQLLLYAKSSEDICRSFMHILCCSSSLRWHEVNEHSLYVINSLTSIEGFYYKSCAAVDARY